MESGKRLLNATQIISYATGTVITSIVMNTHELFLNCIVIHVYDRHG